MKMFCIKEIIEKRWDKYEEEMYILEDEINNKFADSYERLLKKFYKCVEIKNKSGKSWPCIYKIEVADEESVICANFNRILSKGEEIKKVYLHDFIASRLSFGNKNVDIDELNNYMDQLIEMNDIKNKR